MAAQAQVQMRAALCILLLVGNHYVTAVAKSGISKTGMKRAHAGDGEDSEETQYVNADDAEHDAEGYHEDGKQGTHHDTNPLKNINSREMIFGAAISGTMFFGWFWFRSLESLTSSQRPSVVKLAVPTVAALFHAPAQFSPLLVLKLGQVSCTNGLPWEWHLAYTIILVLATPFLSGQIFGQGKRGDGKVPIIQAGGIVFELYLYSVSLLFAYDQYSDSASVALALACGWSKAWFMLVVLLSSYVLQAASAWYLAGITEGLIPAVTGANTEELARTGQRDNEKAHQILAIMKLVTEIIPQSIMSWLFAQEVKPNFFIYVSIGLSLTMGIKSFMSGIKYFSTPDYLAAATTPDYLAAGTSYSDNE